MNNKKLITVLIVANLLLIAAVIFLAGSGVVRARGLLAQTTPHLINYQGMLTDDTGNPISGTKTLAFGVFSSGTSSLPLWQENHPGVQVDNGAFSVLLGSISAVPDTLFDEPERWLEIQVDGVTLSPRQRFASVPYALNADKVDGMDASELGAFPSPAYDSGWVPITAGVSLTLTHSLGGNIDNYFVDMTMNGDIGVNIQGFGNCSEIYWHGLTTGVINITKFSDSFCDADEVRVRIWVYE